MEKRNEDLIGKEFKVNNGGFVRVVDFMGDDLSVVQAARVSYGDGTKRIREDMELIRYLMRKGHLSPFEMCEIKLHLRVPMDCWRQWIRHRTASVNEYSTRYSIAIGQMLETSEDCWRIQATDNKQGSAGFISEKIGKVLSQKEKEIHRISRELYEERMKVGVAREQARKDLPLSTFTEAYWKIDLRNLFHFLEIRMDPAAQFEIREYAKVIGNEIVGKWVPISWAAFCDYMLEALKFSRVEVKILGAIFQGDVRGSSGLLREVGWVVGTDGKERFNREGEEFRRKALKIGIEIPLPCA